MTNVVVIYHSLFGHTKLMAENVAAGALAQLIEIDENGDITGAEWDAMHAADAIIFGSPTYIGTVSWQFKKFIDHTSKEWFQRKWVDKIAGGFTISSSPSGDKLLTLQTMMIMASQLGMIWISQELLNRNGHNRLGSYVGVMADCRSQDAPDKIPAGDLETAKLYGERVARLTAKFKGV